MFISIKMVSQHNLGLTINVTVHFTLHTDPRDNVPEFTFSCRSRGGPATTVEWSDETNKEESIIGHETSQLILDTQNSVYDNRLRVTLRNRTEKIYTCVIVNNIQKFLPGQNKANERASGIITGKFYLIHL